VSPRNPRPGWLQDIDRVLPKPPLEVRDAIDVVGSLNQHAPEASWVDLASPPDAYIYILSNGVLHRLRGRPAPADPQEPPFTAACSQTSRAIRGSDRYEFRVERHVGPDKEVLVREWMFQISDFSPLRISIIRADQQPRSATDQPARTAATFAMSLAVAIERLRTAV
jgi:hypothetical protein